MTTDLDAFRQKMQASNYTAWYKYQQLKAEGRSDVRQILFTDRIRPFVFRSGSHIDPREFFGALTKEYDELPADYADALAEEIQDQRQRHQPDEPEFLISTFGRVECQLPTDWHRPLVRKLLDLGMWVEDGKTTTLEHPHLVGCLRDAWISEASN